MKAAAFFAKKDIKLVDVSKPKVKEDGVLIQMKTCGICGSDIHVFNTDLLTEDSTKIIDNYRIIGHEFTGEIIEVGKDVKEFKVGDRVVSVHNKGGMAEYVEVSGERLKNLFRVPDSLSLETAATLEPFCNPTHSFHMREPQDEETVAIFGAGIIGLGYLQLVKAYTKARTIIVDVSELRLTTAERIGADVIINALQTDPVQKIKDVTGDYYVRYQKKTAGGCDVAIDCAGIPLTLEQTLEVLKPEKGTAVVAAVYEDKLTIDPNMIIFKYMTILGSMGYYHSETEEALELIASKKVNRDLLITHRFPLSRVTEAFPVQANSQESVKVLIINDLVHAS
jgi:threonine dehydrogenase-like Zn-dependent dehydrogenase